MRYFIELAYLGKNYFGWQRQPNHTSVQEVIEKALSTILNQPIQVVGCGRTDTGVHASQYYLHFDLPGDLPIYFLDRLNKFLPKDIAFKQVFEVNQDAHARYDAYYRSYDYHLHFDKNPFLTDTSWFYFFGRELDFGLMQQAAALLLNHHSFFPFCKSGHDSKTLDCQVSKSQWQYHEDRMVYHIAANRFLRGMVRLIVGMCINVGLRKVDLEEVEQALVHQVRLSKNLSVEPQGLFLKEVKYPDKIFKQLPT